VLASEVAEETLDGVDRDRGIELGAIAAALAGVVADAPVDRRERIVADEYAPSTLVLTGLDLREPPLDVLARGARRVTRREKVNVDRPFRADRPCTRTTVHQIWQ
jgi:hypothetical protein